MTRSWLVDKSALVRLGRADNADVWFERVNRGLVRVTAVTLLELGFSARNGGDWRKVLHQPPASNLPLQAITPRIEERAIEVQGRLAQLGHHRAASIPDLLIAATAEDAELTVLHVDKDFDLIAGITGQAVERLAGDF